MDTQSVIARTITVAGGRFAPGHLGELTQHLPFDMVDAALTATRTTQARLRDLPSRVVVYLLLAACLFPEVGYLGVWRKLTAGLAGIATVTPSAGGLGQARHRIGAAPLRWLFDLLRGPFGPTTSGETTYTPRLLPSLHAGRSCWPTATSPRKTSSPRSPPPEPTYWYG